MAEENRLTDIRTVRELLSRHGFHFSKAMGQNFLINPTVCPRMAEACGASPETGVLEIGPGIGVLTRELAARAGRVVAVELDERLLPVLRETLAGRENTEVVQGDILKLPLAALLEEKFTRPDGARMPVAVCANLPYYITSPIIMLLLESRLPFTSLTVMVQKEAADRLCAVPGTRECGAVSLAVQYYARAEKLFGVSRGSFMPAPNVDSAVVKLDFETDRIPVPDAKCYRDTVRAAFLSRRKTLENNLVNAFSLPRERAQALLAEAGIPEKARGETLTPQQLAALSALLYREKTANA